MEYLTMQRDEVVLERLRRDELMSQAERARLAQSLSSGQPIHRQVIAWTGKRLGTLGRHLHKFAQDWEQRGIRVYNGGNIR